MISESDLKVGDILIFPLDGETIVVEKLDYSIYIKVLIEGNSPIFLSGKRNSVRSISIIGWEKIIDPLHLATIARFDSFLEKK